MPPTVFSKEDRDQLRSLSMREEEVLSQLRIFRNPPPPLQLDRPCTLGDGIRSISKDEIQSLSSRHEEAARGGRCMKFVPASGAATRMFRSLLRFVNTTEPVDEAEVTRKAQAGDEECGELITFIKELRRFAFYEELGSTMREDGLEVETLRAQGRLKEILEYLLRPRGLNYANAPKGLLKFHRYEGGSRTPFEEHLVEAASYVRDMENHARLHFTVSPEHRQSFEKRLGEVISSYERAYDTRYEVAFSEQKKATETLAVDLENRPFRQPNGKLLFRPSGHGALIENLNSLEGDIVFIKNIDNVVPDRLKETTYIWKKALAGHLLRIQRQIFSYLKELARGSTEQGFLREISDFARNELSLVMPDRLEQASPEEMRGFLIARLHRPLRVCGVVKNEGEPGGGPFWVRDSRGDLSLQIVESAQVDHDSSQQDTVWNSATHFNPVDIVCGLRDYLGEAFDLRRYVDPNAVIITRKSTEGRDIKALELPGLWNGGMAHWNTVFVEVPIATFNPVKTVTDLLREAHQPS